MQQFLDQFAKLPLVAKLITLVVILVVIVAVEYQVFLVPKKEAYNALEAKARDLQVKLLENEAIAANLPKFQEEVNILNEQLKQAVALLPNEANIHAILRQLSILSKKTNIELNYFRPGGEASRGFYSEIPMDLKLSGTYHDLATYLDQIGKLSRIINISNIVFSGIRQAGNTVELDLDCRATTFMFRGGR
ncbi:MAG TPA: type 4a pilus biogenesis protein PilO [Bdellovibrionota bacterium]|nr:type 4a pilus biogenesis protein PilO [Bdellovibrionota bacterium]